MDLLPLILGFLWALTANVQNAIKNIMMFFTITNLIIIPAKNKSGLLFYKSLIHNPPLPV